MNCTEASALVDAEFTHALAAADAARLRQHLTECLRCRARHEALARVDAALEAPLGEARLEQLEGELFSRLEGASAPGGARPGRSRRWARPAAGAVTASVVALIAVAWWQHGAPLPDEYQARGRGAGPGQVSLRAACVEGGRVTASAGPGRRLPCGPEGLVQFVYSSDVAVSLTAATDDGALVLIDEARGRALPAGNEQLVPAATPVGPWLDRERVVRVTLTDAATGAPMRVVELTVSPRQPSRP